MAWSDGGPGDGAATVVVALVMLDRSGVESDATYECGDVNRMLSGAIAISDGDGREVRRIGD